MNKFYGKPHWYTDTISVSVILGDHYFVRGKLCKFIRVTTKGFNFLDINSNRCIMKRHVYDKRFIGKEKYIPKAANKFYVQVWKYNVPQPVPMEREA